MGDWDKLIVGKGLKSGPKSKRLPNLVTLISRVVILINLLVKYNSRVVIYAQGGYIRLTTDGH